MAGDGEAFILGQTDNEPTKQTVLVMNSGDPQDTSRALFVWGEHGPAVEGSSPGFNGVTGVSEAVAGVVGRSSGKGDFAYGVVGSSSGESQGAIGVVGLSNNSAGVLGLSGGESDFAYGVVGVSDSNAGVRGSSDDSSGVYGESTNSYGVRGKSTNSNGVRGESTNLNGVWGQSEDGAGLVGISDGGNGVSAMSSTGWAGRFQGDVQITGHLSKGGGGFKIDHPLDPENSYLYHSFVESSEMKNIYDGLAVLDEGGQALVELPEWFGELNAGFRYQLTPIGAAAPNLHIAEKIDNNRFKIGGGEPQMEVSWQVTGIRKDKWAKANHIDVEQEKLDEERGYYLHPELYEQPEELGIGRAEVLEQLRQQEAQLSQEPLEMPSVDLLARLQEEHRRQMEEHRRQIEELRRRTEGYEEEGKAP